jgi:hypothetical protein
MLSKRSSMSVLSTIVVMSALGAGCGAKEETPDGDTGGNAGTTSGAGGSGAGGAGAGAGGAGAGGAGGGGSGTGGTSGNGPTGGASGAGSGMSGGGAGGMGSVPEMTKEELFPDVQDWAALDVIYDTAYSAYVPDQVFQVPFHVQDSAVVLGDWFAIPADAVSFDEDPDIAAEDGGGVLVTVLADVPEITIGVHSGMLGGTAPLHITSGTPELWEMGRARYDNGVEYELPELTAEDFAMLLLDPNYMIPAPEPNTSCKTCHSTGAKYFEIQHTPTQAARFSDDELKTILTMGTKPAGIGFRVLPDMLGDKTNVQIYEEFHRWEGSDDEIKGLILYLRSLTPTGQGDIKLPDGSYVAPGSMTLP